MPTMVSPIGHGAFPMAACDVVVDRVGSGEIDGGRGGGGLVIEDIHKHIHKHKHKHKHIYT